MLPDTQVKPGVPNDHLDWAGRYIAEEFGGRPNVTIVQIGDHWDLPSLSSYDKKGGVKMEGRRYQADIAAGNWGFRLLDRPISAVADWSPRKVFMFGNHENRIERAVESDAQLEGLMSLADCDTLDWEVHPFLDVVEIDGVLYSHYFYNPMSGRPYSGENLTLRLKNIGQSFTMGHQQTFQYSLRYTGSGQQQNALVAGAFYQHDEDYKGPQGNAHWRGIIVKHEVVDGAYDIMPISLNYLCRRFEGHTIAEHEGVEL